MRLRAPALSTVVGAALVLWGLTLGLRPLSDNSFLTHLATGRLILDGGIPRIDLYSYTATGDPWVVQSWLASALYALVERWWGAAGLLVLTGTLTALLAALVWHLTRPATSLVARVGVAALVVGVGSGMWSERPLLIGLVLLAVTLAVAQGGLRPWILVPVFWVWVNVHGSFPLGLVALVLLALGSRLDGVVRPPELPAVGWALLGTLIGAVSPLGARLLLFPLELLGRSDTLSHVSEWQAPSFQPLYQRLFLLQLLLAVLLLVRVPRWRIALPLVVFGAAALLAVRNVPTASLVLAPGLAAGFAGLGSLTGSDRKPVFGAAVGVLAALGLLLAVAAADGRAFDLERYPERELRWLASEETDIDDRRWFTSDRTGNYLTATLGPDARVFLDDRYDMYTDELIGQYLVVQRGRAGWQDVLDEHRVTAVVWERDQALAEHLRASEQWRTAVDGARWAVWVRR